VYAFLILPIRATCPIQCLVNYITALYKCMFHCKKIKNTISARVLSNVWFQLCLCLKKLRHLNPDVDSNCNFYV
jgi:hypothetical protein